MDDEIDEVPDTVSMRKSRRDGGVLHTKNPFLSTALTQTRVGTKRLTLQNAKGDRLMLASESTGEYHGPAGFHHIVEVDKTKFVKLYANGVKEFAGLHAAGARVFELLFSRVTDSPGADKIWIHYEDLEEAEKLGLSVSTFRRGLRNLLELKFLAESNRPNMYWLNVAFMFNGNRLAFLKEYRLKNEGGSDARTRDALERAGQLRLDAGEVDK